MLPFLDVLVWRMDIRIVTSVYRKPTNTGKYLHFNSHYPEHVKLVLHRACFGGARRVLLNDYEKSKDIEQVSEELWDNGYPMDCIYKAIKTTQTKKFIVSDIRGKPVATVSIPYVKGLDKYGGSILNLTLGLFLSQITRQRDLLTRVKPLCKVADQGVVYEIPCQCSHNYFGQTSSLVDIRVQEYRDHVKKGTSTI